MCTVIPKRNKGTAGPHLDNESMNAWAIIDANNNNNNNNNVFIL